MLPGSKVFVAVLFLALGCSFWALTACLFWEFADHTKPVAFEGELWFLLLTHYSDLFLFFPLFGSVALIAFFIPATVFVDMYWNPDRQGSKPIPNRRVRFIGWFVIGALFSHAAADGTHSGSERSIWQLKRDVVINDRGEGCSGKDCTGRVSLVSGLENVRRLSQQRRDITGLSRRCEPDWFIGPRANQPPAPRYCAATTMFTGNGADLEGRWLGDAACCQAQQRFDAAVKLQFKEPANRSVTSQLQRWLWPLNIFFLVILLVLSVLLALRRGRIEENYRDCARSIDRGVVIGVMAVAFLALTHSGFLEATRLLHGSQATVSAHRSPDTFIALFAIWALLILFSFVHPENKQAELVSRFVGVMFSALAVFNMDVVINFGVRLAGAGAEWWVVALLCLVAVALVALLGLLRITNFMRDEGSGDAAGDAGLDAVQIGSQPR